MKIKIPIVKGGKNKMILIIPAAFHGFLMHGMIAEVKIDEDTVVKASDVERPKEVIRYR